MDTILIGAHVVDFGTAVVGFFLISAVFLSHLCKRYIGLTLFLVAACLAYYFDIVSSIGLIVIVLYAWLCRHFSFDKTEPKNKLFGLSIFIISILLFVHLIPGFNNPVLINEVAVSINAPLYSQYVNFDKAIVAFFILSFVIFAPTKANWRDYLAVIFCCATAYVVAIFIAKNTGLVDYDVKFPDYIFSWILVNLFITTYAEEAFFRGFVQTSMANIFNNRKYGSALTFNTWKLR